MLLFWFYSVSCLFTYNGPLLLIRNESPNLHRFSDMHVSYNVVRLQSALYNSPDLLSPASLLERLVVYSVVLSLHQIWLATLIANNVYFFIFFY